MGTRLRLPDRIQRFNRWYRWPEGVAALATFPLLVTEFGFAPDTFLPEGAYLFIQTPLLALLMLRVPMTYLHSSNLRTGFTRCGVESVFFAVAALGFAATPLAPDSGEALISGIKLALLAMALVYVVKGLRNAQRLSLSPLILFALTYIVLIFIGAGLFMLPRATLPDVDIPFVNALFMSASAACVTGLSLYDVGREFTPFGQWLLLAMIQVGGLGIMTFAAFISIAFGAGMSIRDRVAMGQVLNYDVIGRVGRLVAWILGITVLCEGLGVALMYGHWTDAAGKALAHDQQLMFSLFHSVSAFCNAGFSLYDNSLVRYHGNLPVVAPISLLIVLGGLGFTVIMDLVCFRPWRTATARRLPLIGKRLRRHPLPRLTLHTKLVLTMAFLLTVGGSLIFWLLEHNHVMAGMGLVEQLEASVFQGGVTPRTAGFNTLDYSEMRPVTQYFTTLLMVIGGAPGSAAGGLKMTSIAILLLALWGMIRGRPVELFRRRIADDQVRRVLVVLVIGLILINSALFLLTITEARLFAHPNGFLKLTFEVVSAFATVGLSTGITGDFSDAGKLILTLCMLVGRIGPLSLVFAIGRKRAAAFSYPEESIMLG